VQPWSDLPLWIPELDESAAGLSQLDCARALVAGLRFRPLAQTVRDTLGWHANRPAEYVLRAGMAAEREAELLRVWHTRIAAGTYE
jgi:2'-hydroxyisoflavone reductase